MACDPPVQSPAIAKAKLLTRDLNQASRAGVSVTAHAVLAHLIADAWPTPEGSAWSARTPIATLANRLAVSSDTVRRAVRELEVAELVRCRVGGGKQASVYLFAGSVSAPPAPMRGVAPVRGGPLHRCEGTPGTHASTPLAPVRGVPDQNRSEHRSSSISSGAEGARLHRGPATLAGAADAAAVQALLARRPEWMPEGKPWLDVTTVKELATRPGSTPDVALWALRLTRESRLTLGNPAGYLISRIRKPDPDAVREDAARRARLDVIRRERGLA